MVAFLLAAISSSCLEKIDIPQTNSATVTLKNSGTNYVTGNVTVNPKDSIFFDFNIASSNDMKFVSIQKNTADILKDTLTGATKNSFSAIKKLITDSIPGVYTYRIIAKNATGIYIGSKDIIVTVAADFTFHTLRVMQVPDSVAKTNNCYFSATNGTAYSYTTGATNSALIDFGYYYDTTSANKHTIYALNAPQALLSFYNISSWTKNATIFKRITSPTFANINSKGIIRSTGIANLASGTSSVIKTTTPSKSNLTNDIIAFKTAGGKYGVMTVTFTNQESPNATTYMEIDVKIEN
jgi:hypothetical protein